MGALTDADASAKSNPFNPIPADGIAPDVGPPQAAPAATRSLTQQAAAGFAWALTQSLGLKVAGIAGQIVLARLLVPEHFGVVAVAQGVAGVAQVLQWTGVQDVLIKRQKRFDLWSTPAFWLSASMGVCAALMLAVAGPILAYALKQPQLTALLLVLSIANLAGILGVVPQAKLQSELRFRSMVIPAMLSQLAIVGLSIALAWMGFGPYSLVIPQALCVPAMTLAYWRASGLRVAPRPHFRRWRFMVADSIVLMAIALTGSLAATAGTMALAAIHDAKEVGYYSMGYNLSLQTVMVISGPLAAVLFPSLARLQHDPPRLLAAFVRASRMLALVGVPLCLAQAVAARPGMELLFGHKWDNAIPVTELLSVGLAFAVLGGVSASIFKALGRFRELLWWTVAISLVQVAMLATGAAIGNSSYVAVAALLFYATCGPAGTLLGIWPLGGRLSHLWKIFGPPMLIGLGAAGAAWWAGHFFDGPTTQARLLRLVVVVAVMGAIYIPAARFLQPEPYRELMERMLSYTPRPLRPLARRVSLL